MAGIWKTLCASYGKVASTALATFSLLNVALAQQPAIKWVAEPAKPQAAHVEVSGADAALLKQAAGFGTASDWQGTLSVFTPIPNAPPMAGSYRVDGGVIHFNPLFPLERGITYKAQFTPRSGATIVSTFAVPAIATAPSTVVKTVYPTADVVPENLLKFYLQFSAPMSRGDVYDYIHLLDAQGKEVELPFLRLGEELWDPSLTRLTVLFDPGRIKRGVQPLEEIGPALIEGKRYSLVIDAKWKDGNGQPLKEPYRREFSVGPADRATPDTAQWKLTLPKSGSNDPLRIEFGEPMEHALALRMITISDTEGRSVEGTASLDQNERRWSLTPSFPWREGSYQVLVQTTIEDLAGNNIGKPFDVDVAHDTHRQIESPIARIRFQVP